MILTGMVNDLALDAVAPSAFSPRGDLRIHGQSGRHLLTTFVSMPAIALGLALDLQAWGRRRGGCVVIRWTCCWPSRWTLAPT
jgi:hypothetical protein